MGMMCFMLQPVEIIWPWFEYTDPVAPPHVWTPHAVKLSAVILSVLGMLTTAMFFNNTYLYKILI